MTIGANIAFAQFSDLDKAVDNEYYGGIVDCANPPFCDFNDLLGTVDRLIGWLVGFAISVVVLLFAWAGWLYMTSGGDSNKVKKANTLLSNTAVGFVIILLAFLIVELILVTLGYTGETGSDGVINLF